MLVAVCILLLIRLIGAVVMIALELDSYSHTNF